MKSGYLKIELKENKSIYYSGSLIEGEVILELEKPEFATSLILKFQGEEGFYIENQEEEEESNNLNLKNIFKVEIVLWEDPISMLEPNLYCFPFSIELGEYNFPSSFHNDIGLINYTLSTKLNRSKKFALTYSIPITLLSTIPNLVPQYMKPESFKVENYYGVFNKELIQLFVDTRCSTSLPGGKLLLDIAFMPTKSVLSLELKLKQKIHIKTQDKIIEDIIKEDIIQAEDLDEWEGLVKFEIPKQIIPTISTSNLFIIEYFLLIKANVYMSYAPLELEFPIRISTLNCTETEVPTFSKNKQYIEPTIHLYEESDDYNIEEELVEDELEISPNLANLDLSDTPGLDVSLRDSVSSQFSEVSEAKDSLYCEKNTTYNEENIPITY